MARWPTQALVSGTAHGPHLHKSGRRWRTPNDNWQGGGAFPWLGAALLLKTRRHLIFDLGWAAQLKEPHLCMVCPMERRPISHDPALQYLATKSGTCKPLIRH